MNRQSTDRLRLLEVANLHRPSRAQIGSRLFEGTRLGSSRFALDLDAINLVDRPAIWGGEWSLDDDLDARPAI